MLPLNANKPFSFRMAPADVHKLVAEETERYLNEVTFALYSLTLINDIACQAVVDIKDSLISMGVYKQKVKYNYGVLKSKQIDYVRRFNKLLDNYSMEDFCDWSDRYNDEVMYHFDILKQTYTTAFLKAQVKFPHQLAQLATARDIIFFAIGHYSSWMERLKEASPKMMLYVDLSSRSIESWEYPLIKTLVSACDSARVPREFHTDEEQITMAQKILTQKLNDPEILARALGLKKKGEEA